MLNLKELEKKLDAALANETPESLTSWLLSQRATEGITPMYLADGEVVAMHKIEETFRSTPALGARFRNGAGTNEAGKYSYAMSA